MSNFSQRIDFDFRITRSNSAPVANLVVPIRQFVLVGNSNPLAISDTNDYSDSHGLVYEILSESRALYCTAFSIFFDLGNSLSYQVLTLTDSTIRLIGNLPEELNQAKSLAISNIEKVATKVLNESIAIPISLLESLINTLLVALKLLKKAFNLFTQSYLLILTTVALGGGLFYASPTVLAAEDLGATSISTIQTTQNNSGNNSPFEPQNSAISPISSSSESSSTSSSSSQNSTSSASAEAVSVTSSSSSAAAVPLGGVIADSPVAKTVTAPVTATLAATKADNSTNPRLAKKTSNPTYGAKSKNIIQEPVSNIKFIWPVRGSISRCDLPGHLACDIANSVGTSIEAASSGMVEEAGWKAGGFGNMIQINHGGGLKTIYMHLSSVQVVPGQFVNQSDKIGLLGTTGNSTGPHLHFGVFLHDVETDPFNYLP